MERAKGKFKFPSFEAILHIVAVEVVTQLIWYGIGKVADMNIWVKDIGILAIFIATIFAVAWYLPKLKSRKTSIDEISKNIDISVINNSILLKDFEFHPQRESHNWFIDQLKKAKNEVWCIWCVGGSALDNQYLEVGKIKKIILANPDDNELMLNFTDSNPDMAERHKKSIVTLTKLAPSKGAEVRWWKGVSCNSLVLGDPNEAEGWIILDVLLPNLADSHRVLTVIYKKRFPELYNRLRDVFDKMWDKSEKKNGDDELWKPKNKY
jgi:hypothetical protein